jgi:tetratricopeptide (TPR) repeat protein
MVCFLAMLPNALATNQPDYAHYHSQIMEAEKLLADENYQQALEIYEDLFQTYPFIFLREYQVATQVALQLKDTAKAGDYLKKGIAAGWSRKSIKQNAYLSPLHKLLGKHYSLLNEQYQDGLDMEYRRQVKKMFGKDQMKALGALFTFSSKGQDRYAEKRFAPHSEKQLQQLIKMMAAKGYPGERLIGKNFWVTTILSHHNSISEQYVQADTLYSFIKPTLLSAIRSGYMSPEEFALIDDWYRAVKFNRQTEGYGYLNHPTRNSLSQINALRRQIGLSPVEIRNRLVDLEMKTGMRFYLPGAPWVEGKISITE